MVSMDFFITSLVVVLIPGTGVIYTVSNGLFCGWRASIAAAFGCTIGIVPHLTASVLGLSAIMHMSAVAFQVMKFLGGFYLLYLAWSMWKETGGIVVPESEKNKGLVKIAVRGFLINILNPKLSVFFLAFLPLFVQPDPQISPFTQMFLLSGIFMGLTFGVFILYGLGAHLVSRYVKESPSVVTRVQKSFAVIFAALGVKIMAVDR